MSAAVDSGRFRQALGAFATGVTVVTAVSPTGQRAGVTANSFNSLSLDPPLVLWSLAQQALSADVFTSAEAFAVHVLDQDQWALSERFAARGSDKFAGLAHATGVGGAPVLPGCLARFECRRVATHPGGDHFILVGQVERFECRDGSPLLYHGGRYCQLQSSDAAARLLALQSF